MRRFSWGEMRRYWESHSSRWADLDYARDPEGLSNVCHPGAPLWLNRYYARFQRVVFEQLLAMVGRPSESGRALDVGCGAGRWSRLLADRGYETTGIDLQPELLERNRERHPDIAFEHAALQDYNAAQPFELVASVTVLQHIPFDEQDLAVKRLRELTSDGGYAIVLENVLHQDPHVFANPIEGWQARFERAGFHLIAARRYDYSPFLRLVNRLRLALRRLLGRRDVEDPAITPEGLVSATGRRDALSRAGDAAKRVAVALDSLIEPALIRRNPTLPSVHCGFLFKAV